MNDKDRAEWVRRFCASAAALLTASMYVATSDDPAETAEQELHVTELARELLLNAPSPEWVVAYIAEHAMGVAAAAFEAIDEDPREWMSDLELDLMRRHS